MEIKENSDFEEIKEEIDSTDTLEGKYLTFYTENQLFGVPIADVVQIVGIQEITAIPEYPYYAKGIINLRGSIIPVIDVRLRFQKEEQAYDERTCIIVTDIKGTAIGFIVDAVDEVAFIGEENISPPPKMANEGTNAYVTGIGKYQERIVLVLDTSKILSDELVSVIAEINL